MQSHGVVQLHNSTMGRQWSRAAQSLAARRSDIDAALACLADQADLIDSASGLITETLSSGGRVLIAGNGGSAAEAQHFATELVGRFKREREAYAVIALTADTAILTAIANDYGFGHVFERQVCAYGQPGDLFVAFSTSGESENLILGAVTALQRGMRVLSVTGKRDCRLSELADVAIQAPSTDTQLIQELHTIVLHVLCEAVESALTTPMSGRKR
jgi:D-sedoheptulose 7-phosphate isomerase